MECSANADHRKITPHGPSLLIKNTAVQSVFADLKQNFIKRNLG